MWNCMSLGVGIFFNTLYCLKQEQQKVDLLFHAIKKSR